MLHSILALCLLATDPSLPDLPATPEARQAAVESLLPPRPWAVGYTITLEQRMRELNVPGASVAVIHGGRIDWAAGYGVRDQRSGDPVTTETLFQAASISKSIGAMATLRLAQEGLVDLDAPVNSLLSSWQLPAESYEDEVTPRQILSHTGGLGVHGFPGYRRLDPLPTVVEILNGVGPANTGAVRRIEPAGGGFRYSGGGSTILQLALQDRTGQSYGALLDERVLRPLGMTRSTVQQPLPVAQWPDHSAAHGSDGRVVPGRFHTYPELFPAAVWTTPTDVARFTLELQRALAGPDGPDGPDGQVLQRAWARQMVEPVAGNSALGLFIDEFGGEEWFGHGGSNEGFKCQFYGSLQGGRGVIVMTNGDRGSVLADEITRSVALVYGWPGFVEAALETADLDPTELSKYAGRYGFGPDALATVRVDEAGLILEMPPARPRRLMPLGDHEFGLLGGGMRVEFADFEADVARSLALETGRRATRIARFERWPTDDVLEGELEAGVEFYREVHAANPDDPMVQRGRLVDLTMGHWNAGRLEAGLALGELLCELFPDVPYSWRTLGQLRASFGDRAGAASAFRESLERIAVDPNLGPEDRSWLTSDIESRLRLLED